MDYLGIAAGVAFAVFWLRGAQSENRSPLVWVAASVVISILAVFVLGRGWIGVVVGQLAMFAAITAYRMMREKDRGDA